jgi:hypothetical protein
VWTNLPRYPQLEAPARAIANLRKTATGSEMTMADDYKIAISPNAQLQVTGMGTQLEAKDVQVSKTASEQEVVSSQSLSPELPNTPPQFNPPPRRSGIVR